MPEITITIREAIEAIRKNGYMQIEGDLVRYVYDYGKNERRIVGGCAMGQGAINLGLEDHPHVFEKLLNGTYVSNALVKQVFPECGHLSGFDNISFTNLVEHLNDEDQMTIEEIAKGLDECFPEEIQNSRVTHTYPDLRPGTPVQTILT